MSQPTVVQNVTGEGNIFTATGDIHIHHPLPPAELKERHQLGTLLRKVKQFWIVGKLEKSVHNLVRIDLGKETQIDAVSHPWERILELPDQSHQILPPDKKISQIFDEMGRMLLILGEPGSGKTTTLLELTHELIVQVEKDEIFSQPVPVVFNLSTWVKGQMLVDWLVAELTSKYQINKRIGRSWLENYRVLPLLDGLDEVKPEYRAACVEAISTFGEKYGLAGLAVCSRLEEYISLPVRLKLNGAIRLQPLTREQVYHYLDAAGPKLETLKEALEQDKGLQDLARSPLALDIMSLAYQDTSVKSLTTQILNTVEARRRHLFDTYIERMFKRKGKRTKPFTNKETKNHLVWLAKKTAEHNQTFFLLEQLQPNWLSNYFWQIIYVFISRLIGGICIGLAMGALMSGSRDGLIFGFVGGITVGCLDLIRLKVNGKIARDKTGQIPW